jgi:chaperonin GroES
MQVRPLFDRILLKRLDDRDRTKGGIALPDIAKEKSQRCKVLATGPGALGMGMNGEWGRKKMSVAVNDVVLIHVNAGTTVRDEQGEELIVAQETEVLAVVERWEK